MTDTIKKAKSELVHRLHTALTIELSTIPAYMTALISIKPGKNREAAQILRGVMMEEMLHLMLVGNLIASIGGRARFSAENVPVYPFTFKFDGKKFADRAFEVDLGPFSKRGIAAFAEIELPEGFRDTPPRPKPNKTVTVPNYTVGKFYKEVADMLKRLCDRFGPARVFDGVREHQLGINYYWAGGGRPVLVEDLDTALKAINEIVTQGEGVDKSVFDGDRKYFGQRQQIAHYFRFKEILDQRYYVSGDLPHDPPTGARIKVDYDAVYPIKINAKAADYRHDEKAKRMNDEFNRLYSMMLYQIAEALNGASGAMYTSILNSMHGMAGVAQQMVVTPIAGDKHGRHAAPSFEWVEPTV